MIPAHTAIFLIVIAWSAHGIINDLSRKKKIGHGAATIAHVWTYVVIAMITALRLTYPPLADGEPSPETVFSAAFWPIHATWVIVNKVFG